MGFWSKTTRNLAEDCNKCGMAELLAKNGITQCKQQEEYIGEGGKRILIIAPPRRMDELQLGPKYGDTFAGRSLADAVAPHLNLMADCIIMPATKCPIVSVKKSRTAPPTLIDTDAFKRMFCCRERILKVAKELRPRLVICVGTAALQVLYGDRGLENLSAYHMTGYRFPDYALNAWVMTVPDFDAIVYENKGQESKLLDFSRRIRECLEHIDTPLPPQVNYNKQVRILTEHYDVMQALTSVLDNKPEWFDFDYESNSIKPNFPKSQLYSVSWAVDDDVAYSHPFGGWGHFSNAQLREQYKVFRAIMADPAIKKSAHNLHMEDSWTEVYLKQPVVNWGWDSMLAAHMLDTTTGTKGLKFQTFAHFGFGPYNKVVHPYLLPADGPYNTIGKCDMMTVLQYGGLDSVFGRKLRKYQMERLHIGQAVPDRVRDCYTNLYLPGVVTMSDMSNHGMVVDVDAYEQAKIDCRKEQEELLAKINTDPAVLTFKQRYNPVFNLASDDDMRTVMFNILGYDAKRVTSTGLESVDRDMLEDIDHPLAKLVLRWRKLEKLAGTFIAQYTREVERDGCMHPSYNLCVARSGRSSSSNANLGRTFGGCKTLLIHGTSCALAA